MLMDQTGFVTVGVIGLQGSGKSTVASLLAGNTPSDVRKYVSLYSSTRASDTFYFSVKVHFEGAMEKITYLLT